MDWTKVVPFVAYFAGAAFGVLWPYLRKWLEEGAPFSWGVVKGKLLVALLGLLLMPTLAATLEALGGLGWVVAFGMGIAATTVGHEAQSIPAAWRAGKMTGRLR